MPNAKWGALLASPAMSDTEGARAMYSARRGAERVLTPRTKGSVTAKELLRSPPVDTAKEMGMTDEDSMSFTDAPVAAPTISDATGKMVMSPKL